MSADLLSALALFEGLTRHEIDHLAERLSLVRVPAGDDLLRAGDPSTTFLIVVEGSADITGGPHDDPRVLATVSPGTVLGELGLLLGRPRNASATASGDVVALQGDAAAFDLLLHLPNMADRVLGLARQRLAQDMDPVSITARDDRWHLRPMLPTDRHALAEAVRTASAESLRRRFFTSGPLSSAVLDYLVRLNFVDHFAWVALNAGGDGLGVGRFVRTRQDPLDAEVAFAVHDDVQRRGLGRVLLGATAAAAGEAGIETLSATMLADNLAMRTVFQHTDASFEMDEPGVTRVSLTVASATSLLSSPESALLRRAVHDLMRLTL